MPNQTETKAALSVICTYRVKMNHDADFLTLLQRHWKTLRELDLVTAEPTRIFQGVDDDNRPYFVEIFTWKDEKSVEIAHEHPQVLSVWEPMGALCEPRDGRPPMEFPHVWAVSL